MANKLVLRICLVPLSMATFALAMASLSSNFWLHTYNEIGQLTDIEINVGLWSNCTTTYYYGCPTESCHTLLNVLDFIQAVRAFMVLAIIFLVYAFIGSVMIQVNPRYRGFMLSVGYAAAALCFLIAMAIYTAKVNENNEKGRDYSVYSYGWSHLFGWVAFLSCGTGTIMCLLIDTKPQEDEVKLQDNGEKYQD